MDDLILFAHAHVIGESQRATLDARGIAIIEGPVEQLVVSDGRVRAVQLADGRIAPRDALFFRPALRAIPDGPAAALGCTAG